jgi:glucose-6-phosphate isomerase
LNDQLSTLSRQWNQSLRTLFERDSDRGSRYVAKGAGLRLDYSKHWVDDAVLQALLRLLDECHVSAQRAKLFSGERINSTENRAVLHAALRAQSTDEYGIDGQSVMAEVFQARGDTYAFAEDIREGRVLGSTGETLTDVVNIGIGGSDLGPLMVSEALKPLIDGPRPHYVSNVDGAHLHDVLASLNPATTLILVHRKPLRRKKRCTTR